jgi:hypothetical protein
MRIAAVLNWRFTDYCCYRKDFSLFHVRDFTFQVFSGIFRQQDDFRRSDALQELPAVTVQTVGHMPCKRIFGVRRFLKNNFYRILGI